MTSTICECNLSARLQPLANSQHVLDIRVTPENQRDASFSGDTVYTDRKPDPSIELRDLRGSPECYDGSQDVAPRDEPQPSMVSCDILVDTGYCLETYCGSSTFRDLFNTDDTLLHSAFVHVTLLSYR